MLKYLRGNYLKNYHLTFSRNEANDKETMEVLRHGGNVSIVLDKLPEIYNGYKVVNGDLT